MHHFPYAASSNVVALGHSLMFPVGGPQASSSVLCNLLVCQIVSGQTVVELHGWITGIASQSRYDCKSGSLIAFAGLMHCCSVPCFARNFYSLGSPSLLSSYSRSFDMNTLLCFTSGFFASSSQSSYMPLGWALL